MNYSLLRQELTRDEGLKTRAYKDSLGYWTIGVGHLLGSSPRMTELNEEEIRALLDYDIKSAEIAANSVFPNFMRLSEQQYDDKTEVRKRALVNMCFNLGAKIKMFKKFVSCVESMQWEQAGKEMLSSLWAKQVGDRALRLRDMIVNGYV